VFQYHSWRSVWGYHRNNCHWRSWTCRMIWHTPSIGSKSWT
jgi:hypothetical protein